MDTNQKFSERLVNNATTKKATVLHAECQKCYLLKEQQKEKFQII